MFGRILGKNLKNQILVTIWPQFSGTFCEQRDGQTDRRKDTVTSIFSPRGLNISLSLELIKIIRIMNKYLLLTTREHTTRKHYKVNSANDGRENRR